MEIPMKDGIHILARAVISEGRSLLLEKKTSYTFLPGGHVETTETAISALKRELREELGIQPTQFHFLGLVEHIFEPDLQQNKCHFHEYNLCFLIKDHALKANHPVISTDPSLCFQWAHFDDLSSAKILPKSLIPLLPQWLRSQAQHYFYEL